MPTYGMLVVLFSNSSCEVYQKECRRKDKESIGLFPYMSVNIKFYLKKSLIHYKIQAEREQQDKAGKPPYFSIFL